MIQFQCPHCQATIRVNDSAMGQRGDCPQCNQALLVPMAGPVAQQESDTPAQVNPMGQQPTQSQAMNDLFSEIASPKEAESEDDPIYKAVNKAHQSNIGTVLTGVFFLLIGIGGAIAAYHFSQPKLQRTFTAQLMPADSIKRTLLTRKTINQPELFEQFWLAHPGKKVDINSRILETSVLAQKRGLEFQLFPGPDNDLYRVDVLKNKPLDEFYRKNRGSIEALRKEVLLNATGDFLTQMIEKEEGLKQNSILLIEIRDRMILTAMVKGLGFRLSAVVHGKQYPCVWQDSEDRLYFSLPQGTVNFTIRETDIANNEKIYPNSLRLTVTCLDANLRKQNSYQPGHLISDEEKPEETSSEELKQTEEEAEEKKENPDSETEKTKTSETKEKPTP